MHKTYVRLSFWMLAVTYSLGALISSSAVAIPKDLEFHLEPKALTNELNHPLSVIVKIKNLSQKPLVVFFDPDNPIDLGFSKEKDKEVKPMKSGKFYPSIARALLSIDSGKEYTGTFDLIKYIELKEPGSFEINFIADIRYSEGDGDESKSIIEKGSVKFVLKKSK